jgi:hypothetical protein
MTATPLSKRRQLGDAITFLRIEAQLSKYNLADKTRTTIKIVESWEAGETVPTAQEWQRMRAVFPSLAPANYRLRELYQAAAAEQLAQEQAKDAKPEGRDELSTAVALVMEALPNLRSMSLEADDDGEVTVAYKTREVRIVEDSGSLKVRLR